jgi:hypothetical protein
MLSQISPVKILGKGVNNIKTNTGMEFFTGTDFV